MYGHIFSQVATEHTRPSLFFLRCSSSLVISIRTVFFFYINSLSLLKFVITHYILVHLFVSRLSDPKINTAKPAILHLGTADCRKEKSLDTVVCFY